MVRIGKWDEAKVLFKDGGHDHSGGMSGAHLVAAAFATGAVKWATSVDAVRRLYGATYAKTVSAATSETLTMDGGTGFANIEAALIGKGGTVYIPGTTGPASVVLGASLDATIGENVHLFIWGT